MIEIYVHQKDWWKSDKNGPIFSIKNVENWTEPLLLVINDVLLCLKRRMIGSVIRGCFPFKLTVESANNQLMILKCRLKEIECGGFRLTESPK